DQPIRADAAIRAACQAQHGALEARPSGFPEMHLVAPNRHPGRKLDAGSFGEALGVGQNGLGLEQAEPGHRLFRPFDTERIGDAQAEHLISTAKTEDSSALAAMCE